MRILTNAEVRHVERQAITRSDVTTLVLMRRAGYAIAQFCLTNFKFRCVCIVCGNNDNGGYGMVAAIALGETGVEISVIILAGAMDELSPEAASVCSSLHVQPLWIADEEWFESDEVQQALDADLIIDAIAGSEVEPPLSGTVTRAVQAINNATAIVVSVDVPCGVAADTREPVHDSGHDGVFAHGVITFVAPKPAHLFAELTSGPIAVSEIGIQPSLVAHSTDVNVITGQEVEISFPARTKDEHKSEFGRVLVIGGSKGGAGALGLAGVAALRTGAGLVTIACPQSMQSTVAGFAPELVTLGLPAMADGTISMEAIDQIVALMIHADVLVLRPDLSRNTQAAALARELIARCPLPLVLDAYGLDGFNLTPGSFRVLILHPDEAARLLGITAANIQQDRAGSARRISKETGSCVILKGWRTVIAGVSGETWINMNGNPALEKSGCDDVLSGIAGAALARRAAIMRSTTAMAKQVPGSFHGASAMLAEMSVAAAVHLHGMAADLARDRLHENSVLASDLIESLPAAFRECNLQMERGLFYLQK